MTPDEKLIDIQNQIVLCERGNSDEIICPYCNTANSRYRESSLAFPRQSRKGPPPLCCETFGKAIAAILQRQALGEMVDQANRIEDRIN